MLSLGVRLRQCRNGGTTVKRRGLNFARRGVQASLGNFRGYIIPRNSLELASATANAETGSMHVLPGTDIRANQVDRIRRQIEHLYGRNRIWGPS